MTWYSRPPTTPKGTAQIAMSRTASSAPPRADHRFWVHQMATMIPRMMHSAYARIGNGPSCHTPWLGLGRYASVIYCSFPWWGARPAPPPDPRYARHHRPRTPSAVAPGTCGTAQPHSRVGKAGCGVRTLGSGGHESVGGLMVGDQETPRRLVGQCGNSPLHRVANARRRCSSQLAIAARPASLVHRSPS